MAPREAGASYAAGRMLSSVAGHRHGERRIDAQERPIPPQELECRIDRRRYRRSRHRNSYGLGNLAETTLERRSEIIQCSMNRWRLPLRQPVQSLAHFSQHSSTLRAQILRGCFRIDLDALNKKEPAVVRH